MTNINEKITKEFHSFYSLFEENRAQKIEKIIQANLAKKTYDSTTDELTICLVFDSCSIILIKLIHYSELSITLYHECTGATPLIYHSDISKNREILDSLFSIYSYKYFVKGDKI
ncbi:hypothetical protein [Colwellia sp. MB3u-55]|jgi:hypothetical protein|uniref:hypothetical protein n=1 Tax=Colwellia sp. MB3u-55 TaxID=2759810 RepID=UPI0015F5EA7A|nr:hypothetical protein [Colwellia sp. MB3u-55]MBA6250985.1 hypothetical protein [Colwellia sp. MB3u-55]